MIDLLGHTQGGASGASLPADFPAPPEHGLHQWIMQALHCLRRAGWRQQESIEAIRDLEPGLRRRFNDGELEEAAGKVFAQTADKKTAARPKWPERCGRLVSKAIRSSEVASIEELKARSPRLEGVTTSDFLNAAFPGGGFICVAANAKNATTLPMETLREQIDEFALIVPSRMTATKGINQKGQAAVRCLDNTGPREFLVVEFDKEASKDNQAALAYSLSNFAPLFAVADSGGKSLHSYFNVRGHDEEDIRRFFRYAVALGADPAMWTRCQFARLPGGLRDRTIRQAILYFDPSAEFESLPAPPAIPAHNWELFDACDQWTGDQDEIEAMSDPLVVDGLLREGEVATVIGGAKTHKTWFAMAMALAVARGDDFLGRKTARKTVLYLDYELKSNTVRKRMCMLSPELPGDFTFCCFRGEDHRPSPTELVELIRSEGFEFVVIDSLYLTGWLSEENSNDTTAKELAMLQRVASETGATILVVDHTAKGGGKGRVAVDAARGASAKGGLFDAVLVLRVGENDSEQWIELDATLRDWSRLDERPRFRFVWVPGRAEIELGEPKSSDDQGERQAKILAALSESSKGMPASEIAKRTDISETTARRTLEQMAAQGHVSESKEARRTLWKIAENR